MKINVNMFLLDWIVLPIWISLFGLGNATAAVIMLPVTLIFAILNYYYAKKMLRLFLVDMNLMMASILGIMVNTLLFVRFVYADRSAVSLMIVLILFTLFFLTVVMIISMILKESGRKKRRRIINRLVSEPLREEKEEDEEDEEEEEDRESFLNSLRLKRNEPEEAEEEEDEDESEEEDEDEDDGPDETKGPKFRVVVKK